MTPAPENPLESGESFHFTDSRGTYQRLAFNATPGSSRVRPYVNVLFTKAGNLRSGDIHQCEQHNVVLYGHCELTQVLGACPCKGNARPAECVPLQAGERL